MSILETLGIGLNKTITLFNTEIKLIMRELFNIKLFNLLELNIYTNIIINEKNYNYLLDILKDNFISSFIITFNSKSNEILNKCKSLKDNIHFLVPQKLTKKIINERNSIKINQDNNDIIYWYLKYLFNYKYYDSSSNFISKKKCINSILKYLYIEKKVNIKHNLEENKEVNKENNNKE